MIERLNQSVKQRTKVAKIFANEDSCLRLVSAVVMEISDEWQSSKAYLSLSDDEFLLIDRGGFDRIDANLQKEVYLT